MTVITNHPAQTEIGTQTIPAVRTVKLCKSIDERPVLRELALAIGDGEYVGILGANGAGKSTLLRILATLVPATSGTVHLFGDPLSRNAFKVRARIGMIGHQSMLYRDLSARENLEFFGRLYGLRDATGRADQMLDMIGLGERAADPVKTFSRGMTQRIAIARALLHDPDLLLADEPFDGLDAPSVESLEQLLSDLNVAGKTIVLVNHDIEQTLKLTERAVVLRDGQVALDQPTLRLYPQEVLSEIG
jgi:ABC-type multidrug transport system ATPase subunit